MFYIAEHDPQSTEDFKKEIDENNRRVVADNEYESILDRRNRRNHFGCRSYPL